MKLSDRAQNLKPSATFAIDALAQSLKREGKDIINLSAGQPDFPTPDYIKAAGKEAIDKNFTRYTPVAGMIEFKEAVREKFKRDNDIDYAMDEVIVCTGGKQVLFNAIQSLINHGDEVIIPVPYWVSYPPMVELAGGISVFLETNFEDKFQINPQSLKDSISSKTKVLLLNSPSNPTGSVYDKELQLEIGNICIENGVTVISDEIYEYLTYDGGKSFALATLTPEMKTNTVTVNGLSKAYAMTGWRIGFGGGPKEVIGAMTRYQSHATSNASSIGQYAGITALTSPLDEVNNMIKVFEKRRDLAYNRLTSMPNIESFKPQGAFYIFPKVSSYYGKKFNNFEVNDSMTFCQFMLEQMEIAMVPGAPFGNDDHVRISYSIGTEELSTALDRFEEGLTKLV
jgi:aspartate aminotransferase